MAVGNQGSFPVDIADEGNYFVVHALLPGIRPEDVQVDVQGQKITIRGERHEHQKREGRQWIAREHRTGAFERTLTLPTAIKEDQIEARYEHGVVTLMIHKADHALPQRAKTDTQAHAIPITQPGQPAPPGATPHDERDAVIEASMDSFPASDPPSWNPHQHG